MQSVGGVYLIVDAESSALAASVASDSFETVHVPKDDLGADQPPSHFDLAEWDNFLGYATDLDLAEEARRPVVHLHTSGSTGTCIIQLFPIFGLMGYVDKGHPKKIPWTHEFTVTLSHVMRKDRPEAVDTILYTPLPLYHVSYTFFHSILLLIFFHLHYLRECPTASPGYRTHLIDHYSSWNRRCLCLCQYTSPYLCITRPTPPFTLWT